MPSQHKKTLIKLFLYTFLFLSIYYLVPRLIRFFIPFVVGWIIAWIASPGVKFIEKKFKVLPKHGSWLVIVGMIGLVVGICYVVVAGLIKEGIAFVGSIPETYETFATEIKMIGNNLTNAFPIISSEFNATINEFFVNIDSYIMDIIGKIGTPALSIAGDIARNIPNLLVMTIFMFLSAYFFIADKNNLTQGVKKLIPNSLIEKWHWIKNMFSRAVGGYFVAQFKIMGVIAIILWIGLMLLDVSYAVLWAIVIAILDFLPFFGTGFVIWPWAVYELLTGNYSMVFGLLVIYVVCLLVHQLLQPKFVGNTVGMDSFTTLICMFIGYRISSVFGMILAVPVGIIIINLYKEGAFDEMISDLKALGNDFMQYLKG